MRNANKAISKSEKEKIRNDRYWSARHTLESTPAGDFGAWTLLGPVREILSSRPSASALGRISEYDFNLMIREMEVLINTARISASR